MKIAELYRQKSFVFSIEIYPPKTQESLEHLKVKLKEFRSYHPDFISVTYGVGARAYIFLCISSDFYYLLLLLTK